ncbi:hypothetical protein [Micromonospora auratinigra]|uniref:Uncharacterized protein n=1 Tax=Micromonospora auratinigra TaxID=261654 RepID=A0A1A9A327_9ACTN|nr:hypothetical protein [Micromonospora auratinigra]SBT50530.1 hypothetical protein GA0070611_4804 [Micromonospora auratinigra]
MTVFACLRCGTALTGDLAETPIEELPSPSSPSDLPPGETCPAWVPEGRYAVDPDPFGPPYVPIADDERMLVAAGPRNTVLINPDDLLVRRLINDASRLNGCCGLDGTDGPNLLCGCGAEIATETSDCWTAQVVRLEPLAVVRAG